MINKLFGVFSVLAVLVGVALTVFEIGFGTLEFHTTLVHATAQSEERMQEIFNQLPDGAPSDWNLVLVNFNHAIEEENPPLATLSNGMQIDERILNAWKDLEQAAQAAGYPLRFISGFRTVAEQRSLVEQNVQANIDLGMDPETARIATMRVMTEPGHSEHHTGLAIDIVGVSYFHEHYANLLTQDFANDSSAQWLATNAQRFGFILRYGRGMEGITGIDFEPWHFRYVGIPAAEYMTSHHLTLEEYIELLKKAGR